MARFHGNHRGAAHQQSQRFLARRFASSARQLSATDPGPVVARWLDKGPTMLQVGEYCKEALSPQFTIHSYCPQLANRLIFNCQKAHKKNLARLIFNDYQKAFYSCLEKLRPNSVLNFDTALKILHGCATLRVAHPAMIQALETASSNPRLLLNDGNGVGINDSIRLLLDLSRRSNVSAINANTAFNSLIDKLFPLVRINQNKRERMINLLYAQITVNASDLSFDLSAALKKLTQIGAVGPTPKINSVMAVMWRFCAPERKLPNHIIQALNRGSSKMSRGKTEARYSNDIINAIKASFEKNSLGYEIQRNCNLPDDSGPFNCDFVVRSKQPGPPFCIAIELHGGHHYCLGPKGLILRGADELKELTLAKYRILLLHVPNLAAIQLRKGGKLSELDQVTISLVESQRTKDP